MKRNPAITASKIALAVAALAAFPAHALDFGGYFRAGPGLADKDHARDCYALSGGTSGLKYRLGNECDFYGEFMLSSPFKVEGVEYKANLMVNDFNPGSGSGASSVGINQMYVEAKGFDVAPQTDFWIGKRFYRGGDVHIVDTFFLNMNGSGNQGAGFLTPMGGAKVGVAVFRTDGGNTAASTTPGTKINIEARDITTNPGGKLWVVGTFTKGDFTGGKNGTGLLAQHSQEKIFGSSFNNTLWVATKSGSAGLDGDFASLTATSKATSFRIVESPSFQNGPMGGQLIALFAQEKSDTGVKTTSTNLGGRISYAMTKNFKMVFDGGYATVKPAGGQTANLTKFTIAPTLSVGPDFWSRPELRLYATTAKWNNAANAQTTGGQLAGDAGKTSGTTFGAQVEVWF